MVATVAESLRQGLAHHQSGDLGRAEQIYQGILRKDPKHSEALHLLGVAAHQRQDHEKACEFISQAIEIDENAAHYHNNLGLAYRAAGNAEKAIASYRRAIELAPDYADPHNNLTAYATRLVYCGWSKRGGRLPRCNGQCAR